MTSTVLEDLLRTKFYLANVNAQNANKPLSNCTCSVLKEKDRFVFESEAMGLLKEDIEMSIKNKYLVVKSKKSCKKTKMFSEIDCSVYVGDNIDKEKVSAELEKGVLVIVLPFIESKKDFEISF